jgi:hypothetical protein
MAERKELSNILRRVQSLIERADHELTPAHEAAACREKAEGMMRKYRIEEEGLLAKDPTASGPIELKIHICDSDNDQMNNIWRMVVFIGEHAGCRVGNTFSYNRTRATSELMAHIVGHEGDVGFANLLYTSARLVWSTTIQPTVDPKLPEAENVYRLRNAGIERWRIAQMLWNSHLKDGSAHGRVSRIYNAECRRRNEDPKVAGRSINAKTYRNIFAEEFTSALYWRLLAARQASEKAEKPMVLFGRKERVDEKFYEIFPHLRPKAEEGADASTTSSRRKAKRNDTKKAQAHFERVYLSPTARAARAAGKDAADSIELHAGHSTQRVETKTESGELEA